MVNLVETERETLRGKIEKILIVNMEIIGPAFGLSKKLQLKIDYNLEVQESGSGDSLFVVTITLQEPKKIYNDDYEEKLENNLHLDLLLRRVRKCLLQLMEVEDDLKKIATLTIKADTFEKSITFKQKFINSEIQFLVFQKRVDVLIEEYKTLRQEILQHLNVLDTLLNYNFIAIAGSLSIIGYLSKNNLSGNHSGPILICWISLLTPIILFLINQMRLAKAIKIAQIGYYLSSVELEINHAFNKLNYMENQETIPFFEKYELDISWERYLRTIRRSKYIGQNRRNIVGIYEELWLNTFFFSLVSFILMISAFLLKDNTGRIQYFLAILGVILFLLLNLLAWMQFLNIQEWQKAMTYSDKVTRIKLNPLEIFMKDLKQSLEKLFNNTDNK
ncbi:MAG: hypothetical protein AN485_12050 [Anabaena sp. MDT14b]|jgi:hypothetical protein|nr:MAG: hypothetical protein AN485_12050 [Anabaena sp. MDT14b]